MAGERGPSYGSDWGQICDRETRRQFLVDSLVVAADVAKTTPERTKDKHDKLNSSWNRCLNQNLHSDTLLSYPLLLTDYSTTHPRPGTLICLTFLTGSGHPMPPVPSARRYGTTQHSRTPASAVLATSFMGLP